MSELFTSFSKFYYLLTGNHQHWSFKCYFVTP